MAGKAKNYDEDEAVTDYEHPSEKYPAIRELGIARGDQRILESALLAMREHITAKKEAERAIAVQNAIVVKVLTKNEIELPCKIWCGRPWSFFVGTNTSLSAARLLELGVSAEIIEQATTTKPHGKPTILAVEPKAKKEE